MLPETDLAGAIRVAEKVRVDVSRVALPHNGSVVRTSASIGIVAFPEDGRTSAELMRRADMAMYEAKRRGRDQIVRFAREVGAPPARVPAQQRTTPSGAAVAAPEVPPTPTPVIPEPAPPAFPPGPTAPASADPQPVPQVPPASPGRAPWEPA
jgi:hypothetical protein